MKHYALIGRSLTHSYSKSLFDRQQFPNADYRLCPMPSLEGLRQWIKDNQIDGFNVTNPYKQAILPLLDNLSPEARDIGAVNCIVVDQGRLMGHNTDAPAFQQTLQTMLQSGSMAIGQAYILGTGGAARAVAYALDRLGIPHRFVSRHPEQHPGAIGYDQLPTPHSPLPTLLVNATPVGMYPHINATPLPITHYPLPTTLVYDLVYNPSPSLLLQQAAALGAQTKDGSEMLHLQAVLSWQLWQLL